MFYSSDAEGLRTFLRDKLGLKATDIGDGWLIFDLPEADMGCHPSDDKHSAPSGTQDISFYCNDLEETVKELKAKGVKFKGEIGGGFGVTGVFGGFFPLSGPEGCPGFLLGQFGFGGEDFLLIWCNLISYSFGFFISSINYAVSRISIFLFIVCHEP